MAKKSMYEIAVDNGLKGTEEDFLKYYEGLDLNEILSDRPNYKIEYEVLTTANCE